MLQQQQKSKEAVDNVENADLQHPRKYHQKSAEGGNDEILSSEDHIDVIPEHVRKRIEQINQNVRVDQAEQHRQQQQ